MQTIRRLPTLRRTAGSRIGSTSSTLARHRHSGRVSGQGGAGARTGLEPGSRAGGLGLLLPLRGRFTPVRPSLGRCGQLGDVVRGAAPAPPPPAIRGNGRGKPGGKSGPGEVPGDGRGALKPSLPLLQPSEVVLYEGLSAQWLLVKPEVDRWTTKRAEVKAARSRRRGRRPVLVVNRPPPRPAAPYWQKTLVCDARWQLTGHSTRLWRVGARAPTGSQGRPKQSAKAARQKPGISLEDPRPSATEAAGCAWRWTREKLHAPSGQFLLLAGPAAAAAGNKRRDTVLKTFDPRAG